MEIFHCHVSLPAGRIYISCLMLVFGASQRSLMDDVLYYCLLLLVVTQLLIEEILTTTWDVQHPVKKRDKQPDLNWCSPDF